MDWIAIVSGFAVGAIVGMTGVSGGSLMTPLLLSVSKLNPTVAIGSDLRCAAITKSAGSVLHHQAGHVNWKITGLLLAGSIPAAFATIGPMHFTGITNGWAAALTYTLGIALLLTAVTVAYKQVRQRSGLWLERWIPEHRKPWVAVGCGMVLGVLMSPSAIGATLILLLYPRLKSHEIVGIDIAHAVPLTLVAGIGYATLGHVDWSLLGALLIGSIPGIWIGAQLTRKMPETLARTLLCGLPVSAGLKVIT